MSRSREAASHLLPPGRAFTRARGSNLGRLLDVLCAPLGRVEERAEALRAESAPDQASELLPRWEKVLDVARLGRRSTDIEQRRLVAIARMAPPEDASLRAIREECISLGYVDIEFRLQELFHAGVNVAGDPVPDDAWAFVLEVHATSRDNDDALRGLLNDRIQNHVLYRLHWRTDYVAPFDPASVLGMVGHWLPENYDPATGELRDLSAGAHHLTQDVEAARPTLTVVGGAPALAFDGTQFLGGSLESAFAPGDSITAFVVARFAAATGNAGLLCLSDNGSTNRSALLLRWDGDVIWRIGPTAPFSEGRVENYTDTSNAVFAMLHETSERAVLHNGAPGTSQVEHRPLVAPSSIRLGALHPDSVPFTGTISEVLIFNHVLAIDEFDAVQRHLADKHGVTLAH